MNVSHRKYMRTLTNEFKEKADQAFPIADEHLLKFPKQGKIMGEGFENQIARPQT